MYYSHYMGLDIVDGIATRHGLDSPGIEPWVGSEVFCTRRDWPWGPPSFLYNWYHVSCLGVKRLGRGIDNPPPSGGDIKERVELYPYSSSGPLWPVLGSTKNHITVPC